MQGKNGILYEIQRRELGVRSNFRANMHVLKAIIMQNDTAFTKLWESHSRTPIFYDSNKIYFDHYRICYTVAGFSGIPQILYKLHKVPTSQKIEDCLCCHAALTNDHLCDEDYNQSCFLALTSHNWLHQLNLETGKTMESIFISPRYRFRHISWETQGYNVVIKSTISNRSAGSGQYTGLLCALVFLKLFPMQFIGLVEINKSVFGKDISDALAMDGLLLICHHGLVRLYSLKHIFQNCTKFKAQLNKKCPETMLSDVLVGQLPLGLPVNIDIKVRPPVLFEVQCCDNDLQIGGYPWQYIIQPVNQHNIFQVYTLEAPYKSVTDGLMKFDVNHIEPDRAMFHFDDSGRILHYSSTELRFLRLNIQNPEMPILERLFVISLDDNSKTKKRKTHTSSGRRVKYTYNSENADEIFQHNLICLNYDDDLDIIVLLVANSSNSSCHQVSGQVHLYSNQTGYLLKKMELKESWEEDCEHSLHLDCDVLIHIVKNPHSYSSCYVYSSKYRDA